MFLLVTFTASFTIFCHCACTAAAVTAHGCHRSCCEKGPEKQKHNDCQGMQAVKLNLQARQTANAILAAPTPLTGIISRAVTIEAVALADPDTKKLPQQWSYKHSPPNLLSFYQCFLI